MQISSFREEVVAGRQDVHAVQDADQVYLREGREGSEAICILSQTKVSLRESASTVFLRSEQDSCRFSANKRWSLLAEIRVSM